MGYTPYSESEYYAEEETECSECDKPFDKCECNEEGE